MLERAAIGHLAEDQAGPARRAGRGALLLFGPMVLAWPPALLAGLIVVPIFYAWGLSPEAGACGTRTRPIRARASSI